MRIAVIGAGMAGATCARRLADAGADVHVFDKSRGVGGRLATRRVTWRDEAGGTHETAFDHGAPGFSVQGAAFARFVHDRCLRAELHRWNSRLAPCSVVLGGGIQQWVAGAEMPALCGRLVHGLRVSLGKAVDAIHRDHHGWSLECKGELLAQAFSHVVLAMPPRQAAELMARHRADWARQARLEPMAPCWTLMAVVDEHAGQPAWDVALPPDGPLAWIIRNDRKPGRRFVRGHAHYVVHAKADWSTANLELPDADVQATMLAALADMLPAPPRWRFSQAHRWRYANVVGAGAQTAQPFWLDADQGLGVCGDYLGGSGVEGAWTSGDALAAHLARQQEPVRDTPCHHEDRSTT